MKGNGMPTILMYRPNRPVLRHEVAATKVGAIIDELATKYRKAKDLIMAVDVHLDEQLLQPSDANRDLEVQPDSQLRLIQNLSGNAFSSTEPRMTWIFAT